MSRAAQAIKPRSPDGKFLPVLCADPNCDGVLELDFQFGRARWICNGLTYDRLDDPLRACERSFDAHEAARP